METKYTTSTTAFRRGYQHNIITLFFEYTQLKMLYRQGWLRFVSKEQCESVADHSFGVAFLGYMIADQYRTDLNPLKVMQLGMFHEFGEVHAGDITPADNISDIDKHNRERASIEKVFSSFPNMDKYIGFWEEYEAQITPESIFVKQIDRLEMAMQARLYEHLGHSGFNEFFDFVEKKLEDPELKQILEEIISSRK